MVRRALMLLAAATLFATPALAGRAKVPALEAGTVRETAAADGKVVVEVKKGDNLMVLGKRGEWSQVMTDGGKKGWVLSKVVSAGGLSSLDSSSTVVAAAEGDTAMALRGRPNPPRTVIVGMGGVKSDMVKKLGELVKAEKKLKVLEVKDEASVKAGLEGAKELAGKNPADVVVSLQQDGTSLKYEVVDLKHAAVLGSGTGATVEEVAKGVANLTAELVKNPADQKKSDAPTTAPVVDPGSVKTDVKTKAPTK